MKPWPRAWAAWEKLENLQRNLMQADIYCRPGTFLAVVGLIMCAGFLAAFLKAGTYAGLGAAAVLGYVPFVVVRMKKNRKTNGY